MPQALVCTHWEDATNKVRRGSACPVRENSDTQTLGTPSWTPLPGSQEVTDRVPGTDEHLRLMAPKDCGFVGWNLHVSVYFHWFRMIICHRKQGKTQV